MKKSDYISAYIGGAGYILGGLLTLGFGGLLLGKITINLGMSFLERSRNLIP
jgi:hypothetical protein